LQIDYVPQIRALEEMMASRNSHFKSKPLQQAAQFAKIPAWVALKIPQSFGQFLFTAHLPVAKV